MEPPKKHQNIEKTDQEPSSKNTMSIQKPQTFQAATSFNQRTNGVFRRCMAGGESARPSESFPFEPPGRMGCSSSRSELVRPQDLLTASEAQTEVPGAGTGSSLSWKVGDVFF